MRTETLTLKFSTEQEAQAQCEKLKIANPKVNFCVSGDTVTWQSFNWSKRDGE
jgi:hypothetical protein